MSLTDALRPIDDRTFEDLVAESRARIQRYAPEWTDQNDNEFGMALVQLFAWLAEQQIFRMARVPELNYIKFLEMVGIALRPAEPARAEVTFPLRTSFADASLSIPRRTQVAAATADGSGPIVFETERTITALAAPLDRVQTGSGAALRDVSAANDARDESFSAFGPTARDGATLVLGFGATLPFPEVELDLAIWVANREDGGRGRAEVQSCGGGSVLAPADLVWESWDGAGWRRLTVLADETAALTRTGHVRLRGPRAGQIVASPLGAVSDPRFWIRVRLARSGYTHPPELLAVRTNTAPALQAETIEGEVLGGTNATLDQVLTLSQVPVIAGSVELEINEAAGFQPWHEVSDFFGCGPLEPCFTLNRRTGEIQFGTGDEGRLPVGNPQMPGSNARVARYRTGGGKRGNVPAGDINALQTPIDGVDTGAMGNLFAAYGGTEEETLDQAIARAQRMFASRDRGVTATDLEALALQSGPVARAEAMPLAHPDFPGVPVPGVTSLVILPDLPDDPAPTPSSDLMRQVCAYLEPRRPLTAELFVVAPIYVDVRIEAELIVETESDSAVVLNTAIETLNRFFHPLFGGRRGTGWTLGGTVHHSLVASQLMVPGVLRVGELRIAIGKDLYPVCTDAPLPPGALLRVVEHGVVAFYEEEGADA